MMESLEVLTDFEEHVSKHLLLEQFAVPGTLYISVDEKLFYTQKFGHRIKVEVAFDYNLKDSQQRSVDSPGYEVGEVVNDPVDSPEHEDIPVDDASMSSMKLGNVYCESINSKNAEASVATEVGSFQKKRASNMNVKPFVSRKQLVKDISHQTDKNEEIMSVKIELEDDKYNPDIQVKDSNEKPFLVMEADSVQRKGKSAYNCKEEKTTSAPFVPKKRYVSRMSTKNLKVKLFPNRTEKSKEIKTMKVEFDEAISDPDVQETQVKNVDDSSDTDPSKIVTCPYCNKSFKNQKELISHRKIDPQKQYPCPKCDRVYKYKAHYILHLTSEHQEETVEKTSDNGESVHPDGKSIKCEVCGATFENEYSMKIHLMSHTSEYSHQCCVCSQKMCSAAAHLCHMKKEHSESGPYQCKICKIWLSSRSEISKHRSTHSIDCGLCGQVFSSRTERYVHYNTVHENDDNLLKCPQCGRLYCNKEAYESHLKYHETSKKTQCPICGLFVLQIKKHIARSHASELSHGESSDNKFVCDKCPKQFNNKSSFKRHLISHTGEKHHKCPECSKLFPYNNGLRDHYISVHSQAKPHVCKICGKACSLKGNLKKHMMQVHKTDAPFKVLQCIHCGEGFTQKKSLEEHVDQKHCFEETTSISKLPPSYFQMNTTSYGQIS